MKMRTQRRCMVVVLAAVFPCLLTHAAVQATFYVSPTGTGDYSQASPGSLSGIQAKVRTVNTIMTGDIVVYLKGGVYTLTAPMNFGPRDGGTGANIVAYRNASGEKPIISGGKQVTGWTQGSGNIWSAQVPGVTRKIRNMFVNGERATMAKGPNVKGQGGWGTGTLAGTVDGVKFTPSDVALYANPSLIELHQVIHGGWGENTYCVSSIAADQGSTVFRMQEPYWAIAQYQNLWSVPGLTEYLCDWGVQCAAGSANLAWWEANEGFDLYNAMELLDTPGEFYFNATTSTLYYMPRAGEALGSADVEVALVEGLVSIKGSSLISRVTAMQFWGITFEYADWLMVNVQNSYGYACTQATAVDYQAQSRPTSFDQSNNDFHSSRYQPCTTPLAAINVESAQNIDFEWNVIKHTGSVGISLKNDVSNSSLIGNLIYDVGGSGINVGHAQHVFIGDSSAQYPQEYGPTREGACKNNAIRNNLVYTTSRHFLGQPAIAVYCTEALDVSHNEVYDCPYTGISVGWGWTNQPTSTVAKNNKINYNRVHGFMKSLGDGGAIYTLGQQPGSQMIENYIYDTKGALIYLDEGTSGHTVQHNVGVYDRTNPDLVMINENESGTNTKVNNDTQDKAVMDSSGLQGCYRLIVNEPIAPQPGESPCAATAIGSPSMSARSIAGAPVTRMQIFDLRGRHLGKPIDIETASPRMAVGGKRFVNAGMIVLKREGDAGGRRAVLVPFVK